MIEETAIQTVATLPWQPVLAALAYVAGIALLLLANWRSERDSRIQLERTQTLESQLAEALRGQLGLQQAVAALQEQVGSLRLRQTRVEKRAPDARRIDHAVRLVQQGHAEPAMLRELGLSDGEAQLLLRLHRADPSPGAVTAGQQPGAAPSATSQAAGLAQALRAVATA